MTWENILVIYMATPVSQVSDETLEALSVRPDVLALQQRGPDETQPDGQQLELGRRFVASTRAMRHLWIWVQALDIAEDHWTRKLKNRLRLSR